MRILITSPWFPWPDTPIRGIWVIDHAKAVALEHEVAILAFSPREEARGRFQLSDAEEQGLRTLRISYPPPRLPGPGVLAARAGTIAALDRLASDGFVPDIVNAHIFLAAPAALTAARRTGAPLVVLENLTRVTDRRLSMLERMMARVCYRRSAIVCPTNDLLAAEVRRLGARVVVKMPNVLDTEQFATPKAERGRDREIRAIAVGSLDEKKGHRHLLDAMALALPREPRLRLDLVGDGPLRRDLERQAASLNISGSVRFHGYKSKAEVATMMRASDIHLLPSLRENLPLVVAEAMAIGIPTVGTRVGGVPEMLDERTGVVVPRADPEALANAMLEVCSKLEDYDRQAMAALARERYGYEGVARRWSEVYEAALTGRAAELGTG